MALLKREFARSQKGPVSSNEDWWFLCRDTDTGEVFVLHEWAHTDVTKPTGKSNVGTKQIELSVFLMEPKQTSVQAELRKLIGSLVEGQTNAPVP
jgi:hypothetical protein